VMGCLLITTAAEELHMYRYVKQQAKLLPRHPHDALYQLKYWPAFTTGYSIFTCAQKLTRWPAYSSARHRN